MGAIRLEQVTKSFAAAVVIPCVNLDIRGDAFHPEWNYSVIPRKPKS